jgi:hypothetical protein
VPADQHGAVGPDLGRLARRRAAVPAPDRAAPAQRRHRRHARPPGRCVKAGFADDLPDGLIDALLDRAASIQSPISQVELLALGGAIARVDSHATAFPFRQARWLINIPATWRAAADDEPEIAWARGRGSAPPVGHRPFLLN